MCSWGVARRLNVGMVNRAGAFQQFEPGQLAHADPFVQLGQSLALCGRERWQRLAGRCLGSAQEIGDRTRLVGEGAELAERHVRGGGGDDNLLSVDCQQRAGHGPRFGRQDSHGTHNDRFPAEPESRQGKWIGRRPEVQSAGEIGQGARGALEVEGADGIRALPGSEIGAFAGLSDGAELVVAEVHEQLVEGGDRAIEALGVQRKGRVIRRDRHADLLEDFSRIDAARHLVPGDGMLRLAMKDRPRGGMHAGIARQRAIVKVDGQPPHARQHRFGNDPGIADADEQVATFALEPGFNFPAAGLVGRCQPFGRGAQRTVE